MRRELLGSSNGDHAYGITKGFLNYLARIPEFGKTGRGAGRQLFSKYLESFVLVGMDLNLNSFSRWANGSADFYSSLYGPKDTREPKNFSIANQFDVARIGQLLGVGVIVYCAPSEQCIPRGESLNIYHDYSDFEEAGGKKIHFVLTYCGRLFLLPDGPGPTFKHRLGLSTVSLLSEAGAENVSLKCAGFAEALVRLAECDDSVLGLQCLSKIKTVRDIVFLEEEAEAALSTALERPLVVAVYTRRGSSGAQRSNRRCLKKSVLEIIYKSDSLNYNASGRQVKFSLPPVDDIDFLLAPAGTDLLVRPDRCWRDKMYGMLTILSAEDKFDCSYLFSGMAPGKDFEERLRKRRLEAEEKKRKKYGKTSEPRRRLPEENCSCEVCRESFEQYEFNMDREGPERLLTIGFSCRELLGMMGLDTAENLATISKMVELSIAAFDIESKTVEVDSYRPSKTLYADIDPSVSVEGHSEKVQRPIMIAHLDALDLDGEPQSWTVAGDDEKYCYRMFRSYCSSVRKRRARAAALKEKMCLGLLERLRSWRLGMEGFLKERPPEEGDEGDPEKRIRSACRNSLPGLLEKKLMDLCGLYVVYSFYGSGYDHVLLVGYLAPYWYEKKLRPQIEKRGNKVTAVSLKRGSVTTFRDITKMLAPGTDLRSFGKLFGLEQKKAHFPFSILTCAASLELPSLPEDAESWKSDLGGKAVTRAEIEEAVALFREAKCENVGQYLRTYLRLDVVVLFKSVLRWRESLLETVGVDFVESRKFTISSMSNYAGSLCQADRLRVGCFFPNNRRNYGLLRRGMRG